MKITNKTPWRTDHLKAFAVRVAKEELTPAKRKKLHITFTFTRQHRGSSGYCYWLGGDKIVVRVSSKVVNKVDLAKVLAHEMAHARGMSHAQMRGNGRYVWHTGREADQQSPVNFFEWANDLPVERQAKKGKAPVDVQAVRHKRTVDSIKRWTTKLKRCQTALKKLKVQERYYQKAIERRAAQKAPTDQQTHTQEGEPNDNQ